MKTLLLSPFFLQLLLSSSLPSSFLQITSPLSHDRTARLVSSKETKVNSPKLNNPLETHKNGNYFIGPLPSLSPLSSPIPPSGIPWFTIGDCNHASKRHVISPTPLPLPISPDVDTKNDTARHWIARHTHTGNLHTPTSDAIRPQTNVTGRVNRSQDCEIESG